MKETIKHWLKAHGLGREWLADQIGVTKKTVDNWLSSAKEIPEIKLSLIRRVMEETAAAESARRQQLDPVAQVFSVEVSLPQFRRYSQCALQAQQTLEAWAIEELDRAAEEYFEQHPPIALHSTSSEAETTLRVAEPEPPYGS